ncbi:hypothetical protein AURDEDRAFT_173633 [Auricularia subglabra TFB-10046 SS5]|uniref:F-box domain-containing protein n=1 Tax=Auricularia subglabra (strain TFB-10046 / SS5) TaxID=717982 RepID=J0CZV7_AURST|nr:hypothetical protein AURDEDRAFT_173633 [Auricularia subglabra TFB-10046 SS5]
MLLDILHARPQLRRLALSVSLDFEDLPRYMPQLLSAFSGLSYLHALWLTDVTIDALPLIDACPGQLETLAVTPSHLELAGSSYYRPPRPAWKRRLGALVERHSHTLRSFHCDYSWHLPHLIPSLKFPNVTVILPLSGCRVDMALAAAYPALTHLRLGSFEPEISHLDKVWPSLRHLDLEMWDSGTLSPDHCVRNIAFHALLHNQRARAVAHIAILASPHVTGLRVSWEWRPDTLDLLVEVIALFPNLKYLSIPAFFDYNIEGLRNFTRIVACLPASLRILELRLMMVTQQHLDANCESRDAMIELFIARAPQLEVVGIEWMGIRTCSRNTYHWRIEGQSDRLLEPAVVKDLLRDYLYSYEWPEWP